MTKNYPKFISTLPLGEDKLAGNSHDNIAISISNIIKNQSHEIKKQIIGLEGDWGSGKSNIIKIIQKEEEKYLESNTYLHFIYDSWGHQEDLNRRALLEELIDFLDKKKIIPNNAEWIKKKRELNGKTITSVKNIFPEIKMFWVLFIISFLAYTFLNTIFPLLETEDFFVDVFFGLWKKLISVWLIPTIFFWFGFYFLVKEIIEQFKKNESKNNKLSNNQLFGQVFYILNGKEIESNTTDYVIENEPTNKEFRRFLNDINKELLINKKSLILTIDNIDRLSKDKVKALWSTINIFFAENSENELYDNIWLIIPYDESKIINCFTENEDPEIGRGLIDKTFAVKFRVTPPLYSNWELLLESNLVIAFGKDFINDKAEIHFIKRIFDNYISDSIIKPRQIINYVNDLVTLHIQYPHISYRYLALFSMTKNTILEKPTENIVSRTYINENTKLLFDNDLELDKSIAAIVFGVSLDNAEEVLFDRKIDTILKNGKVGELKKFKSTPSFPAFFEKIFSKLPLQNISQRNVALLPDILNELEELDLIDIKIINSYWSNLTVRLNNSDQFHKQFYDLHKKIILKNIKNGKDILNKCVDVMFAEVNSEITEKSYLDKLYEINEFLNEEVDGLTLKDLKLRYRKIETVNYFYLLKIAPNDFKDYNLGSSQLDIRNYFYSSDNVLDIRGLASEMKALKILKVGEEFDFDEIITDLKFGLNEIKESNIDDILFYFECLKELTEDNPIEDVSVNKDVINSCLPKQKENKEAFVLLLIFALKATDLSPSYQANIFQEFRSTNDDIVNSAASKIESIITLQKLIEIIIENQFDYDFPKKIVKEITLNKNLGKKLNIAWVLKNFKSIKEIIFENDEQLTTTFFKKISSWNTYAEKHLNKNIKGIESIDLSVFDYACKIDNDLSKTVLKFSNDYLKTLSKQDFYNVFDNTDNFSNQLFRKLNNKKLDSELYTQKVIPYLMDYLKEFASGKFSIQNSQHIFLKNLLIKADESSISNFYKVILDCLNNNPSLNSTHVILFVEPILKNNLLAKKPDESIKGVLRILINDSSLFQKYFSTNYKNYIDIIVKAKINKPLGIAIIREKLKNYGLKNDMRIYADKKLPSWSKSK